MKTSELLRTFLRIAPEHDAQALPVYFTDHNGELQPLRGCGEVDEVTGGDIGEFEAGPVSVLYDRRSYRGKGPPASLSALWASLLKIQKPSQQVAIAAFTGGTADVFNIESVALSSCGTFVQVEPSFWIYLD